jgi:GAF domain-containing protein
LTEVAELCVDLGRVIDSRDVPSLVERASAILQAKGVVLWVADSAGAMLRPSVTHGYSEKTVSRLGPLQIDGDNVTSLAFRSMRPQTMAGSGAGASSALAVPLLTASGCVGVLAAETTTDRPAGELLPVARIIAAQFAALIAPAEDEHGSFAATRSSL